MQAGYHDIQKYARAVDVVSPTSVVTPLLHKTLTSKSMTAVYVRLRVRNRDYACVTRQLYKCILCTYACVMRQLEEKLHMASYVTHGHFCLVLGPQCPHCS